MNTPLNDPILDAALEVGGKIIELPKKRPLRIYWSSNHPASISGYGNQTRENVARIRRWGADIACGNFFGQEGFVLPGLIIPGIRGEDDPMVYFATVPQYPRMITPWGEDGCIHHANDWQADCVITLQDTWPMDSNLLMQFNHWIPIVPIDHEPMPNIVKEKLRYAYRIVAMSKFGKEELERNGYHSTYIPHMVDTKNTIILDKKECRKMLNIPEDIFLFGMIGANKELPSRKGFEHAIDAFVKFHEKHPKSGIYFHANMTQPGGLNILEYAELHGIADCIYHIPPYEQSYKVGRDQLTKIMNCFDVLLATSISEGFGIPIIEAQAVGVPVITTAWTSMKELVEDGKTGFAVPIKEKRWSALASNFGIPDDEKIYEAMENIFEHPMDPKYIRDRIIREYDSEVVFEKYWKPFLENLTDDLVPEPEILTKIDKGASINSNGKQP